jgi:hypothetical protein
MLQDHARKRPQQRQAWNAQHRRRLEGLAALSDEELHERGGLPPHGARRGLQPKEVTG